MLTLYNGLFVIVRHAFNTSMFLSLFSVLGNCDPLHMIVPSTPFRRLFTTVAGDAQTIGAAMNHASLNIANALGAWLGGLVVAAGLGYRSPALVGAGLAVLGLLVVAVMWRTDRHL